MGTPARFCGGCRLVRPLVQFAQGQLQRPGLCRDRIARQVGERPQVAQFPRHQDRDPVTQLLDLAEHVRHKQDRVAATSLLGDDLERAQLNADRADVVRALGRSEEARDDAYRSLRILYGVPPKQPAIDLANRLGASVAATLQDGESRTGLADEAERFAEREGGGPVLHEFRIALLEALDMPARAAAARSEAGH